MKPTTKYTQAVQLLKELNCPDDILVALDIWSMLVRADEIKLNNWVALCDGNTVEGKATELCLEAQEQPKQDGHGMAQEAK
jgi:hypothetical protein